MTCSLPFTLIYFYIAPLSSLAVLIDGSILDLNFREFYFPLLEPLLPLARSWNLLLPGTIPLWTLKRYIFLITTFIFLVIYSIQLYLEILFFLLIFPIKQCHPYISSFLLFPCFILYLDFHQSVVNWLNLLILQCFYSNFLTKLQSSVNLSINIASLSVKDCNWMHAMDTQIQWLKFF